MDNSSDKKLVSRWKSGKAVIVSFFVSGIITFVGLAAETYYRTLNEIWDEYQIPYDIKWDYLSSLELMKARVFLLKHNFDKNGLILKQLEKWHQDKYNSMLAVIPEDDGLRTVLWCEYEIVPILFGVSKNEVAVAIPKILNALELVNNVQSKSKHVEFTGKYLMSSLIFSFFINSQYGLGNKNSYLRQHWNIWLPKAIKHSVALTRNNPELESMIEYTDFNTKPLTLMVSALVLNFEMLLKNYPPPSKFFCQSEEAKSIEYYMNAIPELHLKYSTHKPRLKLIDEKAYKYNVDLFKVNYHENRKFLLDTCSIRVKYETFPISN